MDAYGGWSGWTMRDASCAFLIYCSLAFHFSLFPEGTMLAALGTVKVVSRRNDASSESGDRSGLSAACRNYFQDLGAAHSFGRVRPMSCSNDSEAVDASQRKGADDARKDAAVTFAAWATHNVITASHRIGNALAS